MTNDIETLRKFIECGEDRDMPPAFAALERVEKELYLLRRTKEATDAKPDFEKLWEEASNERDTYRAKLVEVKQAATVVRLIEHFFPATKEGKSAIDALGLIAELSADAPAQTLQISDEILRAAQRVIYRAEECGALRDPEATDFGSSLAALRAAIADRETL